MYLFDWKKFYFYIRFWPEIGLATSSCVAINASATIWTDASSLVQTRLSANSYSKIFDLIISMEINFTLWDEYVYICVCFQIYFNASSSLTLVAKFSLITAATLTSTVHTVSIYAMNSTSTDLAAIAAASCLVRDDYRRQIYKIINLIFNKFLAVIMRYAQYIY